MERKNNSDAGIFLNILHRRRKAIPMGVAVNYVRSNLFQCAERAQGIRPSNPDIRMLARIAVTLTGQQKHFVTALPQYLIQPGHKGRYTPGHRRGIGC